jgi:replicative DNA helicase
MTNPDNKAIKNIFDPGMVSQATVQLLQDRKTHVGDSIKTGIADLDEVLNPMRPGELIVVLGYTRNYKSGLMNYISRYHAMRLRDAGAMNQAVITFTWEQSIEEQGIIDIAQLTSLDSNRMMRGQLSDDEWNLLLLGAMRRGTLPWWLVGHSASINERRPRLNMSEVGDVLAWIVDYQEVKPVLVVLDYLQRIKRERGDTLREQFITIVDQAKDLALAFHCPVILGSQAGRTVVNTPSRTWRLPHVDEGQETSNLEQSADKLISVWMPKNDNPTGTVLEYANKTYRVTDNLLILGVMKQKFGPSPRVMELTVYPETNDITCVKTIELNHYASDH